MELIDRPTPQHEGDRSTNKRSAIDSASSSFVRGKKAEWTNSLSRTVKNGQMHGQPGILWFMAATESAHTFETMSNSHLLQVLLCLVRLRARTERLLVYAALNGSKHRYEQCATSDFSPYLRGEMGNMSRYSRV